MLKRNISSDIIEFLDTNVYKCLLLLGVRQCGKTSLLKNMLSDYDNYIYINLEEMTKLSAIFDSGLSSDMLLSLIEQFTNIKLDRDKKIYLVIDEIQVNHNALTSLKYFAESSLDIKVIATGSLLGTALKKEDVSFPVGKVMHLNMYPLGFDEFVSNLYGDEFVNLIRYHFEQNLQMPEAQHELFLNIFDEYLLVGGMPQAVAEFKNSKDIELIRTIHTNINKDYSLDILKYVDQHDQIRITKLLDNLGNQLLDENRKFKLAPLKKGANFKEFDNAFNWLTLTSIVHKCHVLSN